MNRLQKAFGIGALVLSLAGCDNQNNSSQNNLPQYQTLSGRPISVAESYARFDGALSTVIEVDSKKVLATAYTHKSPKIISEGVALIQSEISDGDDDLVTLIGKYDGGKFEIKSLKANGYQVDF